MNRVKGTLLEETNTKNKHCKTPENKQFEELLNSQLSKNKIEEGKIIDGKITKITEKFVFIFIPGLTL